MLTKVFAISASEFVVAEAQPILRQLIEFALLKGIKVRVLINNGEELAAQEALGELKNNEQIKMISSGNSVAKNNLLNVAGQEIWAKGANLELLSSLAEELSLQNENVPPSDYPSVLFLTANREDAIAAMHANFKSVLRPPVRPNASLNLRYLQEVSTQLEVQVTADNLSTPENLKQCAINLINEFNRINETSSTSATASNNALEGGDGTIRSSADMDMDDDSSKTPTIAEAASAAVTRTTGSSSSTATATTTNAIVYSQLPVFPSQIKALAFSYQSLAQTIIRPNNNQPYLPFLLIELALHLNVTVWIMKSENTKADDNFERAIEDIRSRVAGLAPNKLLITDSQQTLNELRWATQADSASEDASMAPASTIYYVSSNQARVNQLNTNTEGFSAIFCQNNPNQELQPVMQALTNIIINLSTSDFIIGQLIGKITLLLDLPSASAAPRSVLVSNNAATQRRVRWPDESEISSTMVQSRDNDNDHSIGTTYDDDGVHKLLYSNNQQPVRHSRAWVAGFFGASALGGAAGAGLAEYFIPEDAFTKEVHATLIASASAVGAGLFGLAYWGVTKMAQLCCQASQESRRADDERSPLLAGGAEPGSVVGPLF